MKRVYLMHDYYGCETGCCGYAVYVEFEDGKERRWFKFSHDIAAAHDLLREKAAEFHCEIDATESAKGEADIASCWEG